MQNSLTIIKITLYNLVLSLLIIYSTNLFAIDLVEAFNSLVSETHAGIYRSQTRGYMTGGNFSVHYPTDNVQLISISTPSFSSGCSGISLFYGGFSYISGQQFTALLKNISTSALGYSFQLALRTLCPVCSTVLSDLQKAAQAANKLALDQCQIAEGLVQNGIENNSQLNRWINHNATTISSEKGEVNDYFSGLNNLSNNVEAAFSKVVEAIDSIKNAGARQQAAQSQRLGNNTWNMLAGLTDIQKIFIQSLIGSTLITGVTKDENKKIPTVRSLTPTLTPITLGKVFMFGARAKDNSNVYLWQCDDSNEGLLLSTSICSMPTKIPLIKSKWYKTARTVNGLSIVDFGFYGMTYALLLQALQNVENNHPLGTAENITMPSNIYNLSNKGMAIAVGFSKQQIESFISLAPVPLYRALNIAAIYPEVAEALVNNIAGVVASHYTLEYLHHLLDTKHADNSPGSTLGLSPKEFVQLEATIRNISATLDQQMEMLLTHLQAKQAWTAHINQVQSLIYEQTIASGLNLNFAYSTGLIGGSI